MGKTYATFEVPPACALCGESNKLKKSHIIPDFGIRHLRRNGPFISVDRPKMPRQDGTVVNMLCESCELQLSRWEHPAREFLFPLNGSAPTEIYGDWMLPFGVSLAFRALAYLKHSKVGPHAPKTRELEVVLARLPDEVHDEAELALQSWRGYLLGVQKNVGSYSQHVFSLQADVGPYVNNSVAGYTSYLASGEAGTFVQMGAFCFIGMIRRAPSANWGKTQIQSGGGRMCASSGDVPLALLAWLKRYFEAMDSASKEDNPA